ncbi:MAG: peptide chain release factor N(5)-glutamine methyltransferase [Deltaproteobacteria bacterium]|nr:peptide chain release factor N(5)-glutamine methyltransferase [Deltaproteobacteria bacterium]
MAVPQASWTILATLRWTADYFRTKGVPEARASAEILLAHTLGVSRLDLYLRYDQPLNPEELARFKALMVRRREGEPVAYLTGHREFWSLDIRVTPAVLIPRPETETLVAAALEAAETVGAGLKPAPTREHHPKTQNLKPTNSPLWGAEVGVGSGAVVIALAKELPSMVWVGLDRSGAALAVARDNARRQAVLHRVHFLQADLLAGLKPTAAFALLVANLPYVPRAEWEGLPREIKAFEPPGALLGGEDGLDLIRPLIRQAQQYVKGGGWVLLEVGDQQAPQVAALFEETGAYDRIETIKDFSGMERVVRARRRDGTG